MSQYRVGLLMSVQDRWSPTLHAQSRMLNRLQRQVSTLKRMAGQIGLGASGGTRQLTAAKQALANARQEGKLAVIRARTEQQIVNVKRRGAVVGVQSAEREQQARVRTQAVVARTAAVQTQAAERETQARLRTQAVVARTAAAERAANASAAVAESRLQSVRTTNAQRLFQTRQLHITRLSQLRQRGDDQARLNQERLYQAQMRSYLLQERINRQSGHSQMTPDQQRVQDRMRHMREPFDAGNRIFGGMLGIDAGIRVAKGVFGIGTNEDVRHHLQERTKLEQLNLDTLHPGSNAMATQAAEQLRHMVRGQDMADTVHTIKDLINVTGHLEEALNPQLMRKFAQFKVANTVAYGLSDHGALEAIRSAELLIKQPAGMTDHQKLEAIMSRLELINKVMAGTGGGVNPTEIYSFINTAQSARMGLSDDGLLKLVPIMQEMTGNRTGTSLMSLMQNLANGRAYTSSVKNMLDLGLINTRMQRRNTKTGKMETVDGVEYTTTGRVMRMLPGALKGDELLRTDPVRWVEKYLMPKTKGMSQAEISRMVGSIISNRTGAALVETIIAQNTRINKDFAIIKGSRTIEETDRAQQDNYLRQEYNFTKSLATLRQKLGVTILPTLTRYADKLGMGVDRLNDIVSKYPEQTKVVAFAAAIGGIALTGAGAVMVLTGVLQALRGLAALRAVAPVIAAAGASGVAGAAGAGVAGAAGGVAGGAAAGAAAGAARGGATAAAGGFFRTAGAFLFGSLIADAIARSPIARAVAAIGGFFGRAVAGAGGALARVGILMGGTLTGQALATIGSSLVAGLGSLIGGGLLVAAAMAVGVGIGTLIYKGLESSGFADKMESWLAANLPSWALGDAGAAREGAAATAASASGAINAKYGLTGQGLIDYNRDMRERRAKGLPTITPQQYSEMLRGQGPVRPGVAGGAVSDRIRAQRTDMGLAPVGMPEAEWQQLKRGGGPVRANVVAEELKARAEGKLSPYLAPSPDQLGQNQYQTTINLKVEPGKVPEPEARQTSKRAGRLVEDSLYQYLSTGVRPTNSLAGPLR